ncbi:MAG: hypothetical protein ACI8X5_000430 [Planctomycetota bacterium]|jgi:hypothetical protein
MAIGACTTDQYVNGNKRKAITLAEEGIKLFPNGEDLVHQLAIYKEGR